MSNDVICELVWQRVDSWMFTTTSRRRRQRHKRWRKYIRRWIARSSSMRMPTACCHCWIWIREDKYEIYTYCYRASGSGCHHRAIYIGVCRDWEGPGIHHPIWEDPRRSHDRAWMIFQGSIYRQTMAVRETNPRMGRSPQRSDHKRQAIHCHWQLCKMENFWSKNLHILNIY